MTRLGHGREFDLVRAFLTQAKRRTHQHLEVGPGDDCAIIPPFAMSADMAVENVHFKRAWLSPEEIGYRAAASALSDLAAVAAQPVAALVSFAFGAGDARGWAQAVMKGATNAIEEFDAVLAGGDVTRSDDVAVIDVTVIGKVAAPILRSGARPGDDVWVTGSLGGAAAAVAAWNEGKQPSAPARVCFAHPVPRVREALWLKEHSHVHAMIDISDGIASDAGHIAAASNCRVRLDAALVPVAKHATLVNALQGGEDYELCFAAGPHDLGELRTEFEARFGVTLTKVGTVETGDGIDIVNGPEGSGFDHFAAT